VAFDASDIVEESASFLKKRSKKLLSCGLSHLSTGTMLVERSARPWHKSFLLLFFKKAVLPFFLLPPHTWVFMPH